MVTITEQIGWENGEIKATPNSWLSSFYESGIDGRYNGKFHTFSHDGVVKLIENLDKAIGRCEQMKPNIPKDGSYNETHGVVTMRISGTSSSVSLGYRFGILFNRPAVDRVIGRLRVVLKRGPQMVLFAQQIAATSHPTS